MKLTPEQDELIDRCVATVIEEDASALNALIDSITAAGDLELIALRFKSEVLRAIQCEHARYKVGDETVVETLKRLADTAEAERFARSVAELRLEARSANEKRLNNTVTPGGDQVFTFHQILAAVNGACLCGGKGPKDGCCQACEVWHRIHGR